ncbi:MAG: hypothetical protein ABFD54_10380 [Armatimonadota bacterium]|nr:hypothetical protein [bacterium]
MGLALGQCGTGIGMGNGPSSPAPGGGMGGDNRNTGPHAKIKEVKGMENVPSAVGSGGMIFSAGETKGAPDAAAPASVPYTDVLPNYRKAAESALQKEKVPPAYRTRVKDYFSKLAE